MLITFEHTFIKQNSRCHKLLYILVFIATGEHTDYAYFKLVCTLYNVSSVNSPWLDGFWAVCTRSFSHYALSDWLIWYILDSRGFIRPWLNSGFSIKIIMFDNWGVRCGTVCTHAPHLASCFAILPISPPFVIWTLNNFPFSNLRNLLWLRTLSLNTQCSICIPYSRKYWRSLNLAVCPRTVY